MKVGLKAAQHCAPSLASRVVHSGKHHNLPATCNLNQLTIAHSAAMPELPMEARCGTRVPCDLRVLVMVHPAIFGPGVLLNVSITGALLQTPLVLNPLTQIELEVEGAGLGRSSIMASVTRRELNQYGVAFRSANNKIIDRMLQLAQSQTDSLHVPLPGEHPRERHH